MRRSHKTNTLILVSNHIKSIYEDQWINDVFHYTGEGTTGDQSLDFQQNKTLRDSGSNGIDVHLFEVFRLKQYTYRGRVRLVDKPYQSTQLDQNGTSRNVWIFPLEIVGTAAPIAEEDLEHANQQRAIKVKSLTDEELLARIQNISPVAGTVEVKSQRRQRNHYVVEMDKRRANGVCQLCKNPAPFARVDGTPFLEVHHIIALSDGGEDSLENTVALCPNCHRKVHALGLEEYKQALLTIAQKKALTN